MKIDNIKISLFEKFIEIYFFPRKLNLVETYLFEHFKCNFNIGFLSYTYNGESFLLGIYIKENEDGSPYIVVDDSINGKMFLIIPFRPIKRKTAKKEIETAIMQRLQTVNYVLENKLYSKTEKKVEVED